MPHPARSAPMLLLPLALAGCAGNQRPTAVPVTPETPFDLRVPEAPEIDQLMELPGLWKNEAARSPFKVSAGDLSGDGNFDRVFGALARGAQRNPFLMVEQTPDGPRLVERRPSADGRKAIEGADKDFSARKLDDAIDGYQKVIETDPLWPKPYFYVAAVLKEKRDYQSADEWIERGLRLASHGDAFGYAMRAEMLLEEGKSRLARETLARSLALDPYSAPALRLLEKLGGARTPGISPPIRVDKGVGHSLTVEATHPAWKAYGTCKALLLYDGRLRDEFLQGLPAGTKSPLEETTCGFLAAAAYRQARAAGAPEDADLERWSKALDAGLLRESIIYEVLGCRFPELLQLLPEDRLRMAEYTRLFVVPAGK